MKETSWIRSPGLPSPITWIIDRVHCKASIGSVHAMVVPRVIHGCSREVIGVYIMRPIGVDAWNGTTEKQRRWWHHPHCLWMVIKPWMVGRVVGGKNGIGNAWSAEGLLLKVLGWEYSMSFSFSVVAWFAFSFPVRLACRRVLSSSVVSLSLSTLDFRELPGGTARLWSDFLVEDPAFFGAQFLPFPSLTAFCQWQWYSSKTWLPLAASSAPTITLISSSDWTHNTSWREYMRIMRNM